MKMTLFHFLALTCALLPATGKQMKQANENLQVMESMVPPAGAMPVAIAGENAIPVDTKVIDDIKINIKVADGATAPSVPPQPVATAIMPPAPAEQDNSMANTYGFLRSASNNVGNTVEGVLNVESSLADMKKDLDTEYTRWQAKKKVLLQEREKLNSDKSRLNGALQTQKDQRAAHERIQGNVEQLEAENDKQVMDNIAQIKKNQYDQKTLETEVDALKCSMTAIQQAKQAQVDDFNRKVNKTKADNLALQAQVFAKNQETNKLTTDAITQNISDSKTTSKLLAEIQALQATIRSVEMSLIEQAQLEETVQRARERVSKQGVQNVKQGEKLVNANKQCKANKDAAVAAIEAAKAGINRANQEMILCQNQDAENQKMQGKLNMCIKTKQSTR